MAFQFTHAENIDDGLRRIAAEQIDKALAELSDDGLERAQKVHQIRKRCKQIRGLLRLVRPASGDAYGIENAWFRDTARALSEARDIETMRNAYDALMNDFAGQVNRLAFGSIRRRLTLQRKQLVDEMSDLDERLTSTAERLVTARQRSVHWTLDQAGYNAVSQGLAKTYNRGREALQHAFEQRSSDAFHEWRKRVKYHWFHCRLLKDVWPAALAARSREARRLAECLGADHDLAVLRERIDVDPDQFGAKQAVQDFLALADRRREQLQQLARPIGVRLYAESARRLVKRWGKYWDATG